MACFDVFNGDADGICALQQLRLRDPRPDAVLITGVKRDISLLGKIQDVENSKITVLDISMAVNHGPLLALLAQGNTIFYADHHFSGDIPASSALEIHIDPTPRTCTSLIIDKLLDGRYRSWAVVGAFGDNLDEAAMEAAKSLRLSNKQIDALRETGILLNYNGYGADIDDLFYPPDQLYQHVHPFTDPLQFHATSSILPALREGYKNDMERAEAAVPTQQDSAGRVFQLPDSPWARRVAGVFSNTLARREPDFAHALLTQNVDGSLRVSVRAPLSKRYGADELCRQFPTGGGRAAAAGINTLPAELKNNFLTAFSRQFSIYKETLNN
jgi:hypothetical protein